MFYGNGAEWRNGADWGPLRVFCSGAIRSYKLWTGHRNVGERYFSISDPTDTKKACADQDRFTKPQGLNVAFHFLDYFPLFISTNYRLTIPLGSQRLGGSLRACSNPKINSLCHCLWDKIFYRSSDSLTIFIAITFENTLDFQEY